MPLGSSKVISPKFQPDAKMPRKLEVLKYSPASEVAKEFRLASIESTLGRPRGLDELTVVHCRKAIRLLPRPKISTWTA